MRRLIIESCSETPNSYVVIDGNVVQMLKTGKTVTIPIDENYHVVQCHQKTVETDKFTEGLVTAMNGGEKIQAPSNVMEILSGNADYKFYLESEKVGPFILGMHWDTKIKLVDDAQVQAKKRENLLNLQKPQKRNLTIVNSSGIKEPMNIVIDGTIVESVKPRKTVTIQIDEESHTISCFCKYMDSNSILSTNEIRISFGHMDYKYYIRRKNQLGFNMFFKGEIEIELAEDAEQHWKNTVNERKEAVLMEERRKQQEEELRRQEEKLKERVESIIEKELDKQKKDRDIEAALSVLSESERQSRVVKENLELVVRLTMEIAANYYCNYENLFLTLMIIKKIAEYKSEIEDVLKYEDILCNRQQRIASIFTGMDNYAEAYQKLEKKYLDKFEGYPITPEFTKKYSNRMKRIVETYQNKEYKKNVELQMFSDTEIEEFYELKELIIFIAMNPKPDEMDNVAREAVESMYDFFVAPILATEKTVDYLPTVDRIIAKTIVFSRVNLIDNVMEDLQKTLEIIGSKEREYKDIYIVTTSQFEVLRKVFEYYKATKEEVAVLEAMYKYNIPRTIEQEQRLAFLKKGNTNIPKMYESDIENEVFRYDYRILQWSEKEITNYIENFTMNSKKCNVPMVVGNFEKSVMVQSFQWENEKIISILKECLQDNFGNRYCVQSVESATVTDNAEDSISAILISENNSNTKGYPWLGFLVVGDQVTLKQMNLSIYALYLPDKIAAIENVMQSNEKIISDVIIIKMKQNPRINNYISTITNILVEVIEEWINNGITSDIYN